MPLTVCEEEMFRVEDEIDSWAEEERKALSPEGLDGEEESPYLRRQKAVAVRRHRLCVGLALGAFFHGVVAPAGNRELFPDNLRPVVATVRIALR